MPRVAVAFGSNVGKREDFILRALQRLSALLEGCSSSGLYETAPLYETSQPGFLNGVALGTTELVPGLLLSQLQAVERELGRQDRGRNGPREIDLDVVWVEGYVSGLGEEPIVPHPRAFERRFVLEPLAELNPNIDLYGFGRIATLLASPSVQSQTVMRVADAPILL